MLSFRLSREFRILIPVFLAFWTWVGFDAFATAWSIRHYAAGIACLWGWYKYATVAHTVEVHPDGSLIAGSLLGTTVTAVRDIVSLKETILFIELKHGRGTIWLSTLSDRIGGFKLLMHELNPAIKTRDAFYRFNRERITERGTSYAESEPGRMEDLFSRTQVSGYQLLPEVMAGKTAAVRCGRGSGEEGSNAETSGMMR